MNNQKTKNTTKQLKNTKISHTFSPKNNKINNQRVITLKKLYDAEIPTQIRNMADLTVLSQKNKLKLEVFRNYGKEVYNRFKDFFNNLSYNSVYKKIPIFALKLNGKQNLLCSQ